MKPQYQAPTAVERAEMTRIALDTVRWLKADGDRDRTHCVHGTYVGDWAGPDYMCGPCEDGLGIYDYALRCAWQWLDGHREDTMREPVKMLAQSMSDRVMSVEFFVPLIPYLVAA